MVLLCPNYNDALSANLTAAINRLTALYRTASFADKAVFAIVVSGYSGGDIVASQVAGAMGMNKGFWLPGRFCMLETANDKGEAPGPAGDQASGRSGLRRICYVNLHEEKRHAGRRAAFLHVFEIVLNSVTTFPLAS